MYDIILYYIRRILRLKNAISDDDVLVIFTDKGFGLKNTEFAAKKKIRFLGNVEEGPRSVIVFSDGNDVSVAYCGKTAKHYQKLFEENSSVEF